jgi:glycosyltransferase
LKISIITVAQNAGDTIADTLNSIASQTWRDIEHIIIDGASGDNTLEVVSAYAHVSKVLSEPDQGLYFAMNKGIALASGEIVGILNADDFYASNDVLEKVANLFERTQCDTAYGNLVYVSRDNLFDIRRYWRAGKFTLNSFYQGWSPPHPTFFVRRSAYLQYGCFDTRFKMAADYELMLRFLLKNKLSAAYLNELMVKMRTGGLSNRSVRLRLLANREDRMAWAANDLKPHLFTLILKPLTKIIQFKFPWQK